MTETGDASEDQARDSRVLISYSHDSPEHAARVLALANSLRQIGIDCWIDQYDPHPAQGWPRWMDRQIERADFVLMVFTERYYLRSRGEEAPGVGHGVQWESVLIQNELYDSPQENRKFIPVVFDESDRQWITRRLRGYTFYVLESFDIHQENGFQNLYRRLTDQPATEAPQLGRLQPLEPVEPQWTEPETASGPGEPGQTRTGPALPGPNRRNLLAGLVVAVVVVVSVAAYLMRGEDITGFVKVDDQPATSGTIRLIERDLVFVFNEDRPGYFEFKRVKGLKNKQVEFQADVTEPKPSYSFKQSKLLDGNQLAIAGTRPMRRYSVKELVLLVAEDLAENGNSSSSNKTLSGDTIEIKLTTKIDWTGGTAIHEPDRTKIGDVTYHVDFWFRAAQGGSLMALADTTVTIRGTIEKIDSTIGAGNKAEVKLYDCRLQTSD